MGGAPLKTTQTRLGLAPYLLCAWAPLVVGALLAWSSGFRTSLVSFLVVLTAAGAIFLAAGAGREAFAPGAGLWPAQGFVAGPAARRLAWGSMGLALVLMIGLQWSGLTGHWTIPLAGLGILGGYGYFAPPLRWHHRGLGEVAGAAGFGLPALAAGFYFQAGHLMTEVLCYGFPLSFAAFNLFLIHGFPRPGGEGRPGGGSLAERLGPVAGALIYTLVNILTIAGLLACLIFPAAPLPSQWGLWPLMGLAVVNQELIKRRAYRKEAGLAWLCRLMVALHLGIGVVFSLGLWMRL